MAWRFLAWIAGRKIALLNPARLLGRSMKTKKNFLDLEIRKLLVRAESGL